MAKHTGIATIMIGAGWLALVVSAVEPSSRPATRPSSQPAVASATRPATSSPASAPSRERLEQARGVFRQLLGQLTEGDKSRIEKLIAQLGADEWKDREEATAALKKEPVAPMALVRQGAISENREIAGRSKDILSVLEAQRTEVRLSLWQAVVTRQRAGDAAVVGDLIALLDDEDFAIRRASRTCLLSLTGQDFGYKANDEADQRRLSAKKAREWWDKNKATYVLAASADGRKELSLDLGNKVTMKLALIPAGMFLMGSPETEKDRHKIEGPQHEVTISKPFYMGVYPVTQEQYEQIMGKNPSHVKGAQSPIETVSWHDAVEFCKKVSQKTGKTVRLPTEAQWEYACRAGTKTRFSFGDKAEDLGDYAWYDGNSDRVTHPVGQKMPNDFGLYDMLGNVWQWCADWCSEDYSEARDTDPTGPASGKARVLRGGCWYDAPLHCRSAYRNGDLPGSRLGIIGFRVVVDSE